MAFFTRCEVCKKDTAHSHDTGCLECAQKKLVSEKDAHLKSLSLMKVEDRLSLLESDIFDIKRAVGKLSSQHMTFA